MPIGQCLAALEAADPSRLAETQFEPDYRFRPALIREAAHAFLAAANHRTLAGPWTRPAGCGIRKTAALRLPRSLQVVVRERTERLSSGARRILELAAVAGRRFDFDLLQELTGMDEQTVLRHMQELVDAQLVNEVSAEEFAFRHALTREAVYATLLKRQRVQFHALVAEAIERQRAMGSQSGSRVADLAYHYREAGNWPKALEYAQRAGQQAQELYAPHEAAEHFTHAIEAAGHLQLAPELDLLRCRGQAYETLGEFERARADYELSLRLAREAGAAQAEWQALLDLGFLWAGRDYSRTGEYFRQALELARATGDPATIAHSLNRVGNWLGNTGRIAEALQRHQEALEIFRDQGSPVGMAATHDLLGLVCTWNCDLPAAKAHMQQAAELFRRTGDKRGLIGNLAAHGAFVVNADTLPWTSQTLESYRQDAAEAWALAQEIGWLAGQAEVQWLSAVTLATFGEFGEALAQANAARQTASEIGHKQWTAAAHCTLGQIYFWLLEPETAIRHFGIALPLAFELGSVWWISYTSAFMAFAQVQLGRAEAAKAALQSAAAAVGLESDWLARPPRSTSGTISFLGVGGGRAGG